GKHSDAVLTPEWIGQDFLELMHDSYDSCIAHVDRQIGLLLDEMDREELLKNTYVIVTSDHGEQLGERGMLIHGASVYRQEVHVPLLVIPPSQSTAATIVDKPVSLRDIPATIAEWANLGPHPFPGRSLTRFFDGNAPDDTTTSPVLCELTHNIS